MSIEVRMTTIEFKVSGMDPVQDDYMTAPVMPGQVTITYFGKGDTRVDVHGYKMKKDGTPGKVWATAVFWGENPPQIEKMIDDYNPFKSE